MKKATGDYAVRKGLCHPPVTTREMFPVTVCHKVGVSSKILLEYSIGGINNLNQNHCLQWIHWIDFDVKVVVHLRLGHLEWNQWKHLEGDIKVGSHRITALLIIMV